jgi:glycosyltransferase involved in cell wall biosynthesis
VLRVALVTTFPRTASEAHGGVEIACLRLAEGLAAYEDIDLHIIALGTTPPTTERWTEPRCTVHRVRSAWPGFLTYWNVTRWRLARTIRRIAPDVVHVQTYAGTVGPRCPVPTVLTTHGVVERTQALIKGPVARIQQWVFANVERRARPCYGYFIAICRYVAEELGDQIQGQIVSIFNAVARSAFEVRRQEAPNRLLHVGRILATKNVHGLIDVAKLLRDEGVDFELHIVGPCDSAAYWDRLKADVARQGLIQHVHLVGGRTPEGVQEELSRAACFVMASFQESAPMVISEAMAAGVPVVAARAGGIADLMEDGRTGFVVEQGDVAGFARRVRQLLESESLRRSFGARAVELARERFHPDVVARETRKVYYAAAGRPLPV